MPELPEVETVCRGLAPAIEGAILKNVIIREYKLRFPIPGNFRSRVVGRQIINVTRRAKYIFIYLDDANIIIFHLGMSGRMSIFRPGAKPNQLGPHDHVDLQTTKGTTVRFTDPRKFGLLLIVKASSISRHRLFKSLGPEPLGDGFSPKWLASWMKDRRTPIKSVLLDQKAVAGLGNIYACESLFRANISPKRLAKNVVGVKLEGLVISIKEVLTEAIEAGGSTLRDHIGPTGDLGYFQNSFRVYAREGKPCFECNCDWELIGGIRRIKQSGRSTYYCPYKQR